MALHDANLILDCCHQVQNVPGDAAEIGVYQGESARIICRALPDCTVHLFDTFSGMPDLATSVIDTHRKGEFADTSVERVRTYLDGMTNYEIHEGMFPATAIDVPLRFVHLDCDLYSSTLWGLWWAWWHLQPGGVILSDDYAADCCKGAKLAVDQFLRLIGDVKFRVLRKRGIITKEAM